MSRIEQLPPHIKDPLNAKLRAGEPQKDILAWLEEPCREEGIDPISRSGLSRYATKVSEDFAEVRDYRQVIDAVTAKFGDAPMSDPMKLVREMAATLVYDHTRRLRQAAREDKDAPIDIKGLSQLMLAIQRYERAAETGLKREKDLQEAHRRQKEALAKLDAAAEAADPEEALRQVREDLYGIFDMPADG